MRLWIAAVFLAGMICPQTARADVNVKTCVPEPGTTDITYGDLVNCEINPRGDSDLFRFTGQAGEKLDIVVLRYGGNADQCYRLIQPSGAVGNYTCVGNFAGTRFATVGGVVTLTASGIHTIQVVDGGNDETMSYGLVLWRVVPSRSTAVAIDRFGSILAGAITPRGDRDFYTFSGVAGDTLSLTISRLSGNADQCFRIIEPDGVIGNSSCVGNFAGTRFASISSDIKLAKSGIYGIEIVDGGDDDTFPYNLEVQCFGACPAQGGTIRPPDNCTYTLAPATQVFPSSVVSGTIGVITSTGCPWTASSNAGHLTITSGVSGNGAGTVAYSVSANSGAATRTGTLAIGGQTATITQSGTAPLLQVNPNSVSVQWRQGSPLPSEIVVSVFTNAASLAFTAAASSSGNWLTINKSSGTAPANLALSVNPSALEPGTYQGTLAITAPTANPATQTLAVTLTVDTAGSPKLSVSSDALVYQFAQGSQQVRKERIPVENSGGGTLTFQVSAATNNGGNWLMVAQEGNDATLSAPVPITLTVDPSGLGAGTYTGRVTVTSGDAKQDIPVTVTVSAVRQTILLSQTGLTFTAVARGGSALPQSFGILNTGQGSMDWSVLVTTTSGGNWLAATPGSGTTDTSSLTVPLVTVSANGANLDPGQYSGQIQVQASAADNTPQFASVILNVLPPGSDPGPIIRPTGLIFTEAVGGSVASPQKVTIANLTATQRTFTLGRLTTDGANWFTVTPTTGTVAPNQPVDLTVSVSSAGLAPGIRRGALTLLFQDGSVSTVNLLYVIATGGVSSKSVLTPQAVSAPQAGGCAPSNLLPLITSLGSQFTVPAGWPNGLEAQVVDDCGNPHVSGSVTANFSNGDPPLPLISLKNGRWAGTWQVRNTQASVIVVTTKADDPEQRINGVTSVSGGIQATLNPPVVSAGAVLSSASYATASPLAPGGMVSIFGKNLANGEGSSPRLPLETQLAGTLVTIGGKPAPLVYASGTQINAIIPFGLPVNTRSQVIVRRGDAYTSPESITLAAAQPALFTKTQDGKGQAIAVKLDGNLAQPGTPAKAGDVLVFYCAGLGETTPAATAGQAVPASPLRNTVNPVQLTIGGRNAEVAFAGLVPNFTSLYQINTAVPEGVQPGDTVPVVLIVAGQSSPLVMIAVK